MNEKMFQVDTSHVGTMVYRDSYVRKLERDLADRNAEIERCRSKWNHEAHENSRMKEEIVGLKKQVEDTAKRAEAFFICPFQNDAPFMRCEKYNSALMKDCYLCKQHWLRTGETV